MGHASAASVRASLAEDVALGWHLQYNHYPPIPECMTPVAQRVLNHARSCPAFEDQTFGWGAPCEHKVRLPEGASYRGKRLAPIVACMDEWHLWDFMEVSE